MTAGRRLADYRQQMSEGESGTIERKVNHHR